VWSHRFNNAVSDVQGTQVVTSGSRSQFDAHWQHGMSYLKLGWNWIRLAISQ
jgi:hypothetical protein